MKFRRVEADVIKPNYRNLEEECEISANIVDYFAQ